MNLQQFYLTGVLLFTVSVLTQAQGSYSSVQASIKDEMKRDLLKQIKPSNVLPNSLMQQDVAGHKAMHNDDLLEFSKKYRKGSGGDEFEDKYSLEGLKKSLKTVDVPINQLPDGAVTHEMVQGHWAFVSTATRVDGLVVPTGISLFGGGKKKMSAKAKSILENVFGVIVEE